MDARRMMHADDESLFDEHPEAPLVRLKLFIL
jgi:hypothetical protein